MYEYSSGLKMCKIYYKYRSANWQTIENIFEDKVYFASPLDFNDPFESSPLIENDVSLEDLEIAYRELLRRRLQLEIKSAANMVNRFMRGKDLVIEHSVQKKIERIIENINYQATEPGFLFDEAKTHDLKRRIFEELVLFYNKGIFCVSEVWNSILMWSHYGDSHKGVCLGYQNSLDKELNIRRISYNRSRSLKISSILGMLRDEEEERNNVETALFFRKSSSWKYEREWRCLSRVGLQESMFNICEIVFGEKCSFTYIYTIIKGLEPFEDRFKQKIKFYRTTRSPKNYKMIRHQIDTDEIFHHYPISNSYIRSQFNDMNNLFDKND
ncbi:DUF2971 domain-containing protein [Niveispirillum sp. KHB5.9]|uniref:DUF2971 domain-containing protein n=1 Tax=Niveispirillum sp. KHB5.9 TaxID=3400269 RepID=UPI003A8526A0